MERELNIKKISMIGGLWAQVRTFGRMVKFSHTVFALPFALAAVLLAHRTHPLTLARLGWLLLAMVGARSAAMGFNRIADASLDKKNPRTAFREIPSGKLSIRTTGVFVLIFSGLFIFSAAMFGKLCFLLSFPVLMLLFLYSYTKRFTTLCHIYLGFAISMAPAGAFLALTGELRPAILLLSMALLTYIAGFDVLYACQDIAFDRKEGLYSLPAKLGVTAALRIAAVLHIFSLGFFLWLHQAFQMGPLYLGAVGIIGGLMLIEHRLIHPHDLSRINIAFFHMNSLISITLFLGVLGNELARSL